MKKLIFIVLLALYFSPSFAQKIEGIGDLKIHMSVSDFKNIEWIKGRQIEDLALKNSEKNPSVIWMATINSDWNGFSRIRENQRIQSRSNNNAIIVDADNRSRFNSEIYSPDIEKYELFIPIGINNLQGVDSYETTLTFYKDKLISIYVFGVSPEIKLILTEKYGAPSQKSRAKQITCQNRFGAQTIHSDGTDAVIWKENEEIASVYTFFSVSCGSLIVTSYNVSDQKVMNEVTNFQNEKSKEAYRKYQSSKTNSSKL